MSALYSVSIGALIAGCGALCLVRPAAGLLAFAAIAPFYSLIRESSASSPIFFVWPYLIVGILLGVMVVRETTTRLQARGVLRSRAWIAAVFGALLLASMLTLELGAGAVRQVLFDTGLNGMGAVLSSRAFLVVALVWTVVLAAVAAAFPSIMRAREGRRVILDVAVAAFVVYGLFTVFVTFAGHGILFTGLDGFRYYFSAALIYLPARYFFSHPSHAFRFAQVLTIACVAAAIELLFESYLLNVRGVPPSSLPWVGHLSEQFGYGPEGDRLYFHGRYVPSGLMYMHHMSGLFLLLGWALQLPRALAASSWREALAPLLVLGLIVTAAPWTSRTVLVLLVAAYVFAALAVRASWTRRAVGAVALVVSVVVSSSFLIPGARYDVIGDVAYVTGRAFPNLWNAFRVDLAEVTGTKVTGTTGVPGVPPGTPAGFSAVQPYSIDVAAPLESGGRVIVLRAGAESMDFRYRVPSWLMVPGEPLVAVGALRPHGAATVDFQIWEGEKAVASTRHRSPDVWRTLSLKHIVANPDATVLLEVDLSRDDAVDIGLVSLSTSKGILFVAGTDKPRWIPRGWGLTGSMSATERVAIDKASDGLRFVAGNEPAALVYHVPGAQLPSGEAVTVTAHVSASTAVELTAFRGSSLTRGRSSAPGRWEAIELTVPPQARGGLEVRIEAPRRGEVILSGVNLTFGSGVMALLGTASAVQVAAGQPPTLPSLTGASPSLAASPAHTGAPASTPVAPPNAPAPIAATGPNAALAPVLAHRGFQLLFGRGAEFAAWNQVFFGSTSGFFSTATYSDTKYLEFAQQFGFTGALLLVLLGALSIGGSWRLARALPDGHARTLVVGLTGVVLIGFAALLHLPSLFRVGFGTAVFMAMALLATTALMESRRK